MKQQQLDKAQERMAWLWNGLGQWFLGTGFGIAAVAIWPSLLRYPYLSLGLCAFGYAIILTVGRVRKV
jgi:hypothetical protein